MLPGLEVMWRKKKRKRISMKILVAYILKCINWTYRNPHFTYWLQIMYFKCFCSLPSLESQKCMRFLCFKLILKQFWNLSVPVMNGIASPCFGEKIKIPLNDLKPHSFSSAPWLLFLKPSLYCLLFKASIWENPLNTNTLQTPPCDVVRTSQRIFLCLVMQSTRRERGEQLS